MSDPNCPFCGEPAVRRGTIKDEVFMMGCKNQECPTHKKWKRDYDEDLDVYYFGFFKDEGGRNVAA